MKSKQDSPERKQDPRVQKKGPWIVRLSVALLSPFVFLLLVELALTLFGYGRPKHFFVPWSVNRTTVYLPNPHFCEHFVPPELSRAPESSVLYPKSPSTVRIFVLGSSAANGDPEPAYGFCRQLELLLNEHSQGRSFEVINAAVTSMNSFVTRRIAQDCAKHRPDLFIVYMGNNEVVGPYGPPTLPLSLYKSRTFINAKIMLEKDLRLGQLIRNASQTLRRAGRVPRQWAGMESFLESKISLDDARLQYCYRHFQANVRDIVTAACRSGAKTLLCTVPTNIAACAPFASQHKQGLTSPRVTEWDRLFQAGRVLESKGDFQGALAEYEKARAIDDAYADLAFCMGKCLLALNRVEEAKSLLSRARDLDTLRFRADSTINQIIRQEAQALAGRGTGLLDLEASLEQYNQGRPLGDSLLIDHVHLNVRGNFQIAWAAMQAIREAMPQSLLKLPDRSADDLYKLLCNRMLYDGPEQYRLAMLMYGRKVRPPFFGQIEHDSELAALKAAIVQLRATTKASVGVEALYIEALKRSPTDGRVIRRYCDFLLQNRRLADAVNVCQKYLESRPYDMNARTTLAEAYASGRTLDEAIAVLTARTAPFPNTRKEALEWIGGLYVGQGRYAEALKVYQELHRMDPRDVHTLVNLASASFHTGDPAAAKKALDEALKIDPNAAPVLIDVGNYYVKQDRAAEAQAWFKRAAQADPYNHIPPFSLGIQELRLGQTSEGVRHIEDSVRLKPDFAQGYQTLATAYAQLGKPDLARQCKALTDIFSP
jgi:tetratricopeptide (TPR) repeat protein